MDIRTLLFGFGAPIYDWLTLIPAWRTHATRLAESFPEVDDRRRVVLDVGAGTGVSAFAFKAAFPDDLVVGIDIARPMVRVATRRDTDQSCTFLLGDACRLPFSDASVDAVAGHSFLYLVPDRSGALREIRRVLRPGGRLVLLEPHRQGWPADLRSIWRLAGDLGPRFAFTMFCWRIAATASGGFRPGDLEVLFAEHGLQAAATSPTLEGLGYIATGRV
jgi:ubiquinone/menaquinone biosynthesis C-methylase UbiE